MRENTRENETESASRDVSLLVFSGFFLNTPVQNFYSSEHATGEGLSKQNQ